MTDETERPAYVNPSEITAAAEVFVAALGYRNVESLMDNIRHTEIGCDAMVALKGAVQRDLRRERAIGRR